MMTEEDEEKVRRIIREELADRLPAAIIAAMRRFATGGPVRSGRTYVVGERPCELYFDKTDRNWKERRRG